MNTVKKILLTTLLVGVVGCSEMDLTKVVDQTPATSAVVDVIEVEVLREVVELPELETEVVHEVEVEVPVFDSEDNVVGTETIVVPVPEVVPQALPVPIPHL